MALEFELAGSQIDGARDYQEDAFLVTHLTDANGKPSALVVIADGMGGHAAGNVASNMAVQAFNKHVSANYPAENPSEILEQAVNKANFSIKETVAETPALSGMGCTMVAAILEDGKMWWASVGDSHCYLVRDREITKKNADHSYGGFLDRMEADGTPVEPEPGLSRNMLMSAITGEEINEIDVPANPFELQADDRIILCSDGLDTLSAGKIIQYSEWSESTKECADALMTAVEEANMPRQDNTTAVVVNVKETASAVAVAEEAPVATEAVTEDVGESTAEMSVADVSTEEVEPEPQVGQPAFVEPEVDSFDEEPKSKTGLMIGIAAAVILVIGGVAFTMMGKKPAQTSEPIVTELEMEAEAESDDEQVIDEPFVDEEDEDSVVASEQETVTEEPAAPVAEPTPEKVAAAVGKTIQDSLKSGGKGPLMVVIPAAKYAMGSTSARNSDERPRHDVSVSQFASSQYEITFAQYDLFAKAKGKKIPDSLYLDRETHPVIFISWDDAYYYTKWLSEETGQKYRLASESEWEYMASTGKKTTFWWGYDEEPNRAHCFGCGTNLDPRKSTKIGSFEANAFGLYDTSGNVAEWVHDCWHDNYKGAPEYADVWEGGDCSYRVVRGGAYSTPPQSIRNSKRDKFKSDKAYDHIGIRVVREIP